ncbi:MAG: hypothetical protein GX219_00710 [Tissierellia bacterium]|nr:hypothetical protein [Tissierellia bacterium]
MSTNKTTKFTFTKLPVNLTELKALKEADLKSPEGTAALTILALCVYPKDKEASLEMLDYLKGPNPLSTYDKQFLADRFSGKDYIALSYFVGASPENNYKPTEPFTIEVTENPYSRNNIKEGYLKLHMQSGGADSLRPITLREKPSTGQWFLWEQMLLADIRKPTSSDPWA